MKSSKYIIPIFLLMATACDTASTDINLSLKSENLVNANNNFGFNFFENIIENEDSSKNLMVSPLSISQALSMALNGAESTTFEEIREVLDFKNLPISEINEANLELYNSLTSHDSKVEFTIANSAWYRDDFSIKSDFTSNLEDYYNAEVNKFYSSDLDAAKDDINKWVKNNTNNKIEKIIDNVYESNKLFLINAIYFNGEWSIKFEKSETTNKNFTVENGTIKQVETMIGEADVTYSNEDVFSAIKIPYGYGKFNMVIFLPEEGYTTSDIVPELSNFDFETLYTSSSSTMDIWIPKFSFEYKKQLNEELIQMGMPTAFSDYADFSNISDKDICISKVLHKTYIKVDEEGTEAAAVTSISFTNSCVEPGETIKINRSFLFAIVEEDTNSILFIGRVVDPTV